MGMKVAVIGLSEELEMSDQQMAGICGQIMRDYVENGAKAVVMPYGRGARTERLMSYAAGSGISSGKELAGHMTQVHYSEEGKDLAARFAGYTEKVFFVGPYSREFFLRGSAGYDCNDWLVDEDSGYLACDVDGDWFKNPWHCRDFMDALDRNDVSVLTSGAVVLPGSTQMDRQLGLTHYAGNGDSPLVAVAETIRRFGADVVTSTRVGRSRHICDDNGWRIGPITAESMIEVSEMTGCWPIRRQALEMLRYSSVPLGIAEPGDIEDAGTVVFGEFASDRPR